MPATADYRVTLDAFEGPLDLLLFLIRRAEVDIHEIPVATITDQYLAFVTQLDDVDVESAGEFLVMAATLVELKTRTIAPPEERDDAAAAEGEDTERTGSDREPLDPRAELVRQLLAYQRYRIASEDLDARREAFANRYPLRPGQRDTDAERGEEDDALEMDDVHVLDLTAAYERIVSTIDFRRLGEHVVEMDDTPIALHQEDLLDRLRATPARRITLQQTFAGRRPQERIGLFLATLELVRMRAVTVRQDAIDREIELELVNAEEASAAEADLDDDQDD